MAKFSEKFLKIWYFWFRNPVVRRGEHGGFKWVFRRFWLDISTLSGNFKARFMAAEHPYGFLVSGTTDENIEGFCQVLYEIGSLITTDQGFVNDIQKAVKKYAKRLGNTPAEEDDEEIALREMKDLQEHIELPEKERRKVERDIDRRFRKAAKEAEKHASE